MMEYLLKANAVIILFYIVYKLFLQHETFFKTNRWFLLVGLIAALSVPFVVIPIYVSPTLSNLSTSSMIIDAVTTNNKPINEVKALPIFNFIYVLGVLLLFLRLLIELISLVAILIKNKARKNGRFILVKVNEPITPFSFFNWIAYNPKQHKDQELKAILSHEKAHAKQHHTIDVLLSQLLTIVFWFNPIMWLYKKDLIQNLEFIADANAQYSSGNFKNYQYILLKSSIPKQQFALVNHFYNSLIKKRIVMLQKTKSKQLNVWKYALILPLLGLFLMSFNTKKIIAYPEETTLMSALGVGDVEVIIIDKNTSDAELKELTKTYEAKGITLKFKGIKRNKDNQITKISIVGKTKNTSASVSKSDSEGISPIKIKIEDESISIGDAHKHKELHFISKKDGKKHKTLHKKIIKSKGSNVFIYNDAEDEDMDIEVEVDDDTIIIKEGNTVKEIKKSSINKDGNVYIMSDDDHEVVRIKKEKTIIIDKDSKGNIVKEWVSDDDNEENIEIITTDDDEQIKIKSFGKGKSKFFIASDNNEQPLILLDGKEISFEKLDELDPDDIETMEVLKGESATKDYGEKAKDGVIIITSKKE